MDEVIIISNQFLDLLAEFGCDLTVVPDNQFDLSVLNMKFQFAVFMIGLTCKFIFQLVGSVCRGV